MMQTYPIAAKPPRRKRRGIDERCVLACLDYSFVSVHLERYFDVSYLYHPSDLS
ncbi:hypothetical protein Plhal304r1_c060g0146171 [Plasmopara halstedii]